MPRKGRKKDGKKQGEMHTRDPQKTDLGKKKKQEAITTT